MERRHGAEGGGCVADSYIYEVKWWNDKQTTWERPGNLSEQAIWEFEATLAEKKEMQSIAPGN